MERLIMRMQMQRDCELLWLAIFNKVVAVLAVSRHPAGTHRPARANKSSWPGQGIPDRERVRGREQGEGYGEKEGEEKQEIEVGKYGEV
jgi:hypothetical protein